MEDDGGPEPSVSEYVQCPVCSKDFKPSVINGHLDRCLNGCDEPEPEPDPDCPSTTTTRDEGGGGGGGGPPFKKSRVSSPVPASHMANGTPTRVLTAATPSSSPTPTPSPVFSMFQNKKNKVSVQNERSPSFSDKQRASSAAVGRGIKRNGSDLAQTDAEPTRSIKQPALVTKSSDPKPLSRALFTTDKPLAETLRPKTLEEYFGQNKVVGEHTLLRSLLDSQEIPSLILWGPPGCGKVIH